MKITAQYLVMIDDTYRILYSCEDERFFLTDVPLYNIIPIKKEEALKLINK